MKQEYIPVGCVLPTAVAVGGGGLPQCMLGYNPLGLALTPQVWAWIPPGVGLGPRCGPGSPGVVLTPQVWAWIPPARPPNIPLGLDPPARPPNLPPGCGPGHPLDRPPKHPPGCGPRQHPPVNRILDTCFWKYYLAPTSLRAVMI